MWLTCGKEICVKWLSVGARQARNWQGDRLREIVDSSKQQPCSDCGGSFPPEAMDFHHRLPEGKAFSIAEFRSLTPSVEVLLSEIAKCDLLCANCHRIRHAKARRERAGTRRSA